MIAFPRIALLGCSLLALLATGCASREVPLATRIANALPATDVAAARETDPVGTANADAADDPAIWRNPDNPAASLIVGTDKKAGLYVYGMDGKVRGSSLTGRYNNVALQAGEHGIVVIASDRTDPVNSKLALFLLDPVTAALSPLASVPSGPGEGYGVCVAPAPRIAMVGAADAMTVYAAIKDGSVRQIRINHKQGRVEHQMGASWKLATQIEGCVIDPATGSLFVGEEDVGIWKIDVARPDAAPVLFAAADGKALVADVEGMAIAARDGASSWLVASSQGDNAYAVFDTTTGRLLGRFRINGGMLDGTSETDGIELATGNFGPGFEQGVFIAQDGDNGGGTQNFKLVSWAAILAALGL
ncbi:phytase [Blastomonas fulva]|uniref:phytase n=1 Tax=Blastomonas fulva TaxID=1550728 RepID=UPI0025A4C4B7|nr:phytase [Blastomonas fulva]MDM7929960.1 phytase [Blastomonas fulva]MDM7966275.1 phytase [Blastomonas fulva]